MAVYDDYNGWDAMDHTGHEFYSDFNDYDVTVNVPRNFVVWGTGTLINAAQVLQPGRSRASTIVHDGHDDPHRHAASRCRGQSRRRTR